MTELPAALATKGEHFWNIWNIWKWKDVKCRCVPHNPDEIFRKKKENRTSPSKSLKYLGNISSDKMNLSTGFDIFSNIQQKQKETREETRKKHSIPQFRNIWEILRKNQNWNTPALNLRNIQKYLVNVKKKIIMKYTFPGFN